MLSIGLISLLIAVPLFSYRITPSLFNRITAIILIYSSLLAYNSLYVESLGSGVGIYSGLFHVTTISLSIESFIFIIGALVLMGWAPIKYNNIISYSNNNNDNSLPQAEINNINTYSFTPKINEYSIMVLFTTIGASLLISSSDIISIYLSIELQSFAVYIIATLYRDSESATSAGLKYFLLGGLSSALILLGTALIYSYTGITQFESIYSLVSVSNQNASSINVANSQISNQYALVFGLTLIGVGFLFKVAAAPFHNWAPDVYNGVPTIVTSWLTTIPKISIFVFLLELQTGLQGGIEFLSISNNIFIGMYDINIWKNLLLVTSLISLIIGTIVGLSQHYIKRLLAYSTISHVGFILLALSINTEESIESFVFYIIQYSITNLNTFIIILAFGYIISKSINNHNTNKKGDIIFINDLKGQFYSNPLLAVSLALCLFSIAGIPPLIGFFAKQMVLYSSTHAGYYFLSIVAIVVSVISASYYLKIIKVIYFESWPAKINISDKTYKASGENNNISKLDINNNNNDIYISNVHSILIATLTIVITLFVLQPSILLNSCNLLSLSLFYY